MRVKTFYRALRLLAAVVLFFFVWTFGPIWQAVAFAVTSQKENAKSQLTGKHGTGEQKAEDRFESVIVEMREKIARAGEKHAKGQDDTAERAAISAGRASIDQISEELRAEFSSTEKRLKAAGLPNEILKRHVAFVAHFEKNVKELRANLDGIESAKTKADRIAKMEKARLHLEKTRPPRHHTPLNPDQLPNRNRKATKTVAPRLKREDFERDFPQQKTQNKRRVADSHLLPDLLASMMKQKPILLAFNGPDSDIPFSPGAQTLTSQFAFADSSPFLLAQATGQPADDDLAETPDVQFTDAIRAKAQELGYSPLKIYEWVRNNIEYAPTYGSIQGADMCLQSKICNDMDTASLLIALLRVSGIYSHYEYSTIEIPIEKAMNWVGGVTDPKMVGTILATNGIPAKVLISGGTIKAVQLEHVFVRAFIDYIPSRGAVHKQGDTWIPLDPSFKQYTYTQGIDIKAAVPFDAQTFADQLVSTATISETGGYVTNVNSLLVQQTMQGYQTQVQNYIQQNHLNATVGDVIGKKEIVKQEFGILPETPPYKTVQTGAKFAQVPDNLRATMSFSIPDPTGGSTGLTYTTSLPEIAGKKVTLSYDPATVNDSNLLNKYGGDVTKVPPYLLTLRPVIKINGNTVASGPQMTLGISHDFIMTFYEPGIGMERIQNILEAGGYSAIVLESQKFSYSMLEKNALKFKSTLEAMKLQLANGEQPSVERDNLIGDWLWLQGLYYFYSQGKMLELTEWLNNVTAAKGVSVALTSAVPSVSYIFSMPMRFDLAGYGIDVDRNIFIVASKTGNQEKIKQFMKMAGYISSALEHRHAETLSKTPAISTISLLNEASKVGIPIYTITKDNLSAVLPYLEVPSDVIDDINNAIGAGKVVTVQSRSVSYYGSSGIGYIILDPLTGAGAYKIGGGTNGGFQALRECLKDILLTLCNIGVPAGSGYAVALETTDWVDTYLESGNAINWSSISSADIWYIGIMAVLSLVLATFLVLLAFSGPLFAIGIAVASIIVQIGIGLMSAYMHGTPWWCALPCAPLIVYGYQNWLAGNNYNNPCSEEGY